MQRPPVVVVALGVFAALAAMLPILYLLLRLTEGLEAALAELARPRTLELVWNSLRLAVTVSLTALVLGSLQAWVVVRSDVRAPGVFATLATLPLAIPSYVLALGYLSLFPSLQGFWASWFVMSIATSPYVFLAVSAALIRTSVTNEEVARSLGLGRWQTMLRVTWPQVRPAAIASLMLVVLYSLSEFGAIALLRFDTFTRAIYNAYRGSFDRSAAASLALVLVLITLLVIWFERHYRSQQLSASGAVGRRVKVRLGGSRPFVELALVLLAVISVGVPAAALVGWSLEGSSNVDLSDLLSALGSSLLVATLAGLVIGVFALAIAIWNLRFRSKLSSVVDSSAWVAHALPGIVVALSLVYFGANYLQPLYQTIWLLAFAYLILFLPNALGPIGTPIAQVPRSIEQVAQSLGLSRNAALIKVVLPIASPGVVAGVALAALTVLKELPATLLLKPNGVDTLASRLWQATENLSYAQAAPYALLLIIIAGVPALMLNAQARKLISEVS